MTPIHDKLIVHIRYGKMMLPHKVAVDRSLIPNLPRAIKDSILFVNSDYLHYQLNARVYRKVLITEGLPPMLGDDIPM